MSLLHVFCDIVEESLVGEFQHQLLRIVNWNFSREARPSKIYNRPYFIPVKHADSNSIKITDSLNIPVEFIGNEPMVIVLEFRKVKML
jgi:hypothetical protein